MTHSATYWGENDDKSPDDFEERVRKFVTELETDNDLNSHGTNFEITAYVDDKDRETVHVHEHGNADREFVYDNETGEGHMEGRSSLSRRVQDLARELFGSRGSFSVTQYEDENQSNTRIHFYIPTYATGIDGLEFGEDLQEFAVNLGTYDLENLPSEATLSEWEYVDEDDWTAVFKQPNGNRRIEVYYQGGDESKWHVSDCEVCEDNTLDTVEKVKTNRKGGAVVAAEYFARNAEN